MRSKLVGAQSSSNVDLCCVSRTVRNIFRHSQNSPDVVTGRWQYRAQTSSVRPLSSKRMVCV